MTAAAGPIVRFHVLRDLGDIEVITTHPEFEGNKAEFKRLGIELSTGVISTALIESPYYYALVNKDSWIDAANLGDPKAWLGEIVPDPQSLPALTLVPRVSCMGPLRPEYREIAIAAWLGNSRQNLES